MRRRAFLRLTALGSATAAASPASASLLKRRPVHGHKPRPFELNELSVTELQSRLSSGHTSAVALTRQYLARISEIDQHGPTLKAVIELNPDALGIAGALDAERKKQGPRGPLHGIPLLLKDNIDTHDRMTTTAGSLALAGSMAPRDAFVVERLRAAGVVLLGKANLSEWANFRGALSSSGWSARGGQTRNPYVLDRNPSGSSSGSAVAVAANLCAVAVGTETDGSVISPSSFNGIVGLKPTVGLVSRSGIIPISQTQDTAGPMGRTVTDVAILLGAMTGSDPRDAATAECDQRRQLVYTEFLKPTGLQGARLGVARDFFGAHPKVDDLMARALAQIRDLGAALVDPVPVPKSPKLDTAELEVFRYELKAGMNAYLASRGFETPMRTLQDLIEFNERHHEQELRWFGQEEFLKAQAKGPLTDAAYRTALDTCRQLARTEGLDRTLAEHQLDAIVAPTSTPAHVTDWVLGDHGLGDSTSPAAIAGYPSITVPMGQVAGLPVGISFFGAAWSEPVLLRLAFAFEQATHFRSPPTFRPTLSTVPK